jgi:phosphoribosylamine--glycine ligase
MKILVVGSGGREHALVWKISQSTRVSKLYCAPGNPGIASTAECIPVTATDLDGLLKFALAENIDLTVVGPEQPLAEGMVDLFESNGLPIFGPSKRAAQLEWSKSFAKEFMQRHGIPTASHRAFTRSQCEEAKLYAATAPLPIVVKADGLAAGKGVIVCTTREECLSALDHMMGAQAFGRAAETVIIEECLRGEEASVFAVTDGTDYVTLAPAQDHKRVFDGDQGKNTGGMGAYAPAPLVTTDILSTVERTIIKPVLEGMKAEGRPYKGCLYVGLMITGAGPRVIEFNSRFGDPETQVVLPLYDGDLVTLLKAASDGTMGRIRTSIGSFNGSGAAVCVVLASGGYPDDYAAGKRIAGLECLKNLPNVVAFHAGTRSEGDEIVTAGGRVLGITSHDRQGTIAQSIESAYEAVRRVSFEGMQYRHDIGRKSLIH